MMPIRAAPLFSPKKTRPDAVESTPADAVTGPLDTAHVAFAHLPLAVILREEVAALERLDDEGAHGRVRPRGSMAKLIVQWLGNIYGGTVTAAA
jgi:hypothetical protein